MTKAPIQKWDIRTEPVGDVQTLNLSTGRYTDASPGSVRVKYRPAGKRGRFETFVVVGCIPSGTLVEEVVQKFDAELQAKKQKRVEPRKKAPKLLMDRFKL